MTYWQQGFLPQNQDLQMLALQQSQAPCQGRDSLDISQALSRGEAVAQLLDRLIAEKRALLLRQLAGTNGDMGLAAQQLAFCQAQGTTGDMGLAAQQLAFCQAQGGAVQGGPVAWHCQPGTELQTPPQHSHLGFGHVPSAQACAAVGAVPSSQPASESAPAGSAVPASKFSLASLPGLEQSGSPDAAASRCLPPHFPAVSAEDEALAGPPWTAAPPLRTAQPSLDQRQLASLDHEPAAPGIRKTTLPNSQDAFSRRYVGGAQEGVPQGPNCLIVGKIPRNMGDKALGDSFVSIVGRCNVMHCRIIREKRGRSLCYAFVEFSNEVSTQKALTACELGKHVLVDEEGQPWQVTANRARRTKAAPKKISPKTPPPVETYDYIRFLL